MATIKNTVISDTGFLKLPLGTTGERPTPAVGMMRYNSTIGAPEYYSSTGWISLAARDGSSASKAVYKSTDILSVNPSAPTSWYWLFVNGTAKPVYVNNTYDSGGWVCVATHLGGTALPSLTYAQSATGVDHLGSSGFVAGTTNPHAYTTFMGLAAWNYICANNAAGRKFVTFTAGSQQELNGASHSRRTRWTWTGWGTRYAWSGVSGVTNEVGGVTPDLYNYHVANAYGWSSYDNNPSGCANQYNNAPFWYGACWSGSFWGGNGAGNYANNSFWTSSGSDYYGYGAYYIK